MIVTSGSNTRVGRDEIVADETPSPDLHPRPATLSDALAVEG